MLLCRRHPPPAKSFVLFICVFLAPLLFKQAADLTNGCGGRSSPPKLHCTHGRGGSEVFSVAAYVLKHAQELAAKVHYGKSPLQRSPVLGQKCASQPCTCNLTRHKRATNEQPSPTLPTPRETEKCVCDFSGTLQTFDQHWSLCCQLILIK